MHFAGSIVVPESVERPLFYYANNTVATHALISTAVESGLKHILFPRRLRFTARRTRCRSRKRIQGAHQPVWRVEADDRMDAA